MRADRNGCQHVADLLPAVAAGEALPTARQRLHVEHCLRCQAELVQYRRLLRSLRAMRTERFEPSPGLASEVLAAVQGAGERHAVRSLLRGRRVAYLGGIVAAALAASGGAVLLTLRTRRGVRLVG